MLVQCEVLPNGRGVCGLDHLTADTFGVLEDLDLDLDAEELAEKGVT
jgi:hypothetical protein